MHDLFYPFDGRGWQRSGQDFGTSRHERLSDAFQGRSELPIQRWRIGGANFNRQLAYTNSLLYLTTEYLSKIAAPLFIRLTPDENHVKVCHIVVMVFTLWLIASILAMALRCDLSQPWIDADDAQCAGMVTAFAKYIMCF